MKAEGHEACRMGQRAEWTYNTRRYATLPGPDTRRQTVWSGFMRCQSRGLARFFRMCGGGRSSVFNHEKFFGFAGGCPSP